MTILLVLELSQVQLRTFVMINSSGVEVASLGGAGLTVEVSKAGGAFVASAGTKAEISNGWYSYQFTAGETDTVGPLSVRVTGSGALQQNLEYIVKDAKINAVEFTYTITSTTTGNPIAGVETWFSTDIAGVNRVWSGTSDAFGVVRDAAGNLPRLDAGTYYVWRQKAGYTFDDPDTEVVS